MTDNTHPIGICVIGAGDHSRLHGESLRRIRGERPEIVKTTAVCDLDTARAEKYAADFGFDRTYPDYRLMLEREKPDGVLVMVPPKLLRRVGGDVLAAGFPALIEKPPGWSSAETAELLAIATRGNVPALVSFNRRFGPAMTRAREWLDGARPARPPEVVFGKLARINRIEPENVYSTGIHLIDGIMSLLAPAALAQAASGRAQARRNNVGLRLVFDNGAEGLGVLAFDAGDYEEIYEVFGRDYHVTVDVERGRLEIQDHGRLIQRWQAPADMPADEKNGTLSETMAFLGALQTGSAMRPDLRDGLQAVRAAEAVQAGQNIE